MQSLALADLQATDPEVTPSSVDGEPSTTAEEPQREPLPSDTFRIQSSSGELERLARELSPIVRRDVLVGAGVNVGRALWDRLIVPVDAPEVAPPIPADWLAERLAVESDPLAFGADVLAGRVRRPFPEGPTSLRAVLLDSVPASGARLDRALSLLDAERDSLARDFLTRYTRRIVETPGLLSPADHTASLADRLRRLLTCNAQASDFTFAAMALHAIGELGTPRTLSALFLVFSRAASLRHEATVEAASGFLGLALGKDGAA